MDDLNLAGLVRLAIKGDRSNHQLSQLTKGMDPAKPDEPAISEPRFQQLATQDRMVNFITPVTVRALAQLGNLPHAAIVRANMISCGLDPLDPRHRAVQLFPAKVEDLPEEDLVLLRQMSARLIRLRGLG